ncbi:D-lysergyl-peptide-synthetase subunit 1, partial [Claviceps purpurea]
MSIPIPEKLQDLTAVKSPSAFGNSIESINGDKNKSERHTASSSAVSTYEIGHPCLLTNFKLAVACSGPAITKVATVNDKDSGAKLKNVINGKDISASEVFKGAWAVVLGTYLAKSHVSLDYGVMKPKGLGPETSCNARVPSENSEMSTSSFLLRANDTLLDIIRQNSIDQFMSESQARHLAATMRVVLSSIASAPQQSLADVDMCSSLDYQTLSRWNLKAPIVSE